MHGGELPRDVKCQTASICGPWAFATVDGYSCYSECARCGVEACALPLLAQLTAPVVRKP